MALRRRRLIQRYPLPMVSRTVVTEPSGWDNEIQTISFEKQVAEYCTVQPLNPYTLQVVLGGLTSDKAYTLFTDSFVSEGTDGTGYLGHAVYIPDGILSLTGNSSSVGNGGWFRVVQPQIWGNGVIEHAETFLVKDTTLVDDNGVLQYPQDDIDLIINQIQTKSDLISEVWKAGWLT